jgi:hypothetical protein
MNYIGILCISAPIWLFVYIKIDDTVQGHAPQIKPRQRQPQSQVRLVKNQVVFDGEIEGLN